MTTPTAAAVFLTTRGGGRSKTLLTPTRSSARFRILSTGCKVEIVLRRKPCVGGTHEIGLIELRIECGDFHAADVPPLKR